ncbi:MAG: hypothetical protein DME15_05540 [Candidatus Rokuibacteriota bacterium]|nr:MAG: hypothetical protein DME15_05540 [Candidatus Rokubacteria bacterium]
MGDPPAPTRERLSRAGASASRAAWWTRRRWIARPRWRSRAARALRVPVLVLDDVLVRGYTEELYRAALGR